MNLHAPNSKTTEKRGYMTGNVPHKQGLATMPRVQAVWEHPVFQRELARLDALEQDRAFCRHGARHLLDTARIMWIRALELGLDADREVVYATALLHDVGKAEQFEAGEPHELAGERIAGEILASLPEGAHFSDIERVAVLTAIRGHRRLRVDAEPLERLLYQADKASRACFACPPEVRAACSWPDEKKNLAIML